MFKNILILYTVLFVGVIYSQDAPPKEPGITTRGLFTSHVPAKQDCPNHAQMPTIRVGRKCFYFFDSAPMEWYNARRYCRANGLRLAKILSKQEHDSIVFHIQKMNLEKSRFWFSGTDQGSEGQYYWSETDEPVLYANWAPGQPDNWTGEGTEGEDCFELWHQHSLLWNTRNCAQLGLFICESQ